MPKLKMNLLARILEDSDALRGRTDCSPDSVLIKHDRLYKHSIMRINYTTYDVRRSQDVVKASTSHFNIMVLADRDDGQFSSNFHPFRYARVLGVYHVNVVYIGPGMVDYHPRRMEILWVRWYQSVGSSVQNAFKLHLIRFLPVADAEAFGFVDPLDIVRGCHIIPAFAKGKRHVDGRGLSRYAADSSDWNAYYVNR
jgi:hypothetical protein